MTMVAQKLLDAVGRPFQLGEQAVRITGSMGIATFPEDGEDSETLLRNADAAMYRAKELGRNNFQLCTPELTSRKRSSGSPSRTACARRSIARSSSSTISRS